MRVTIIPVDRMIIRDDLFTRLDNWPFDDDHIHAIQFLDGKGEIELKGPPLENRPFEGTAPIQPYLEYLDSWLASQAQLVEEPKSGSEVELLRARDESGQFIADDPSTPDVNEAWVPAPTTAD